MKNCKWREIGIGYEKEGAGMEFQNSDLGLTWKSSAAANTSTRISQLNWIHELSSFKAVFLLLWKKKNSVLKD